MFTGIIREIGILERLVRSQGLIRLTIHAPNTASLVEPAESVSVNGVCLSVVARGRGTLTFDVIPESRERTALQFMKPGARVNVEPSLGVTDRLNGHLVFGHVDGIGMVAARHQDQGQRRLAIRVPAAMRRFLVPKGPVAVDGVSLTVGPGLRMRLLEVCLIPETMRRTTLGDREPGDRVNVEIDYLSKLVAQLVGHRARSRAMQRTAAHRSVTSE